LHIASPQAGPKAIDDRHGQAFIAMEFLDGVTLKHRIGGKSVENDVLLSPALEIADAIRFDLI
jgi:hypothetical protein